MTNRFKGALDGAGYYAALSICILAVAAAGYFLLLQDDEAPAAADEEEPFLEAPLPVTEDEPLEILQRGLPEELSEEPAAAVSAAARVESVPAAVIPEIPPEISVPVPVVPAAPQLVVEPLQGQTVAAFSVDALLYDKTMGDWRTHDGIDIAAQAGSHVRSASAGTVLSVRQDPLMGTTVTIDHGSGYHATYANLQVRPTVEVGDSVTAGQVIGAVGTTASAEAALGPHLHFSVEKDGDAVDPTEYLSR